MSLHRGLNATGRKRYVIWIISSGYFYLGNRTVYDASLARSTTHICISACGHHLFKRYTSHSHQILEGEAPGRTYLY